jgi:hypothetical protein
MYPDDIDPHSGCRLPLPRREELGPEGHRIYDSLADPNGGTLRGLRGPGGIQLHSEELARRSRPVNQYLRNQSALRAYPSRQQGRPWPYLGHGQEEWIEEDPTAGSR